MEETELKRACAKCGKELDIRGLGTHRKYCDGNPNRNAVNSNSALEECPQCKKKYKVGGLGVHIARIHTKSGQPPKETPHKAGTTKVWTVSLVNGNRQVAGTVPEYVAQRIVRMLI